jgi:NAD kinase
LRLWQVIVGVNPDPVRWDGVLLPFVVADLPKIIPEIFSLSRSIKEVTMAQAVSNNGQHLYAVNDLFIGPKSHTSARYTIIVGDAQEQHSSSGIIVSTGLGSTGWLTSIVTGATGIASRITHRGIAQD